MLTCRSARPMRAADRRQPYLIPTPLMMASSFEGLLPAKPCWNRLDNACFLSASNLSPHPTKGNASMLLPSMYGTDIAASNDRLPEAEGTKRDFLLFSAAVGLCSSLHRAASKEALRPSFRQGWRCYNAKECHVAPAVKSSSSDSLLE